MSTLAVGTIKSVSSAAPVFQNTSGTEKGRLVEAYADFDGSGTVSLTNSYNISSLTDNGTGDYTFTFTNALSSANYCAFGSAETITNHRFTGGSYSTKSTTTCRMKYGVSGGTNAVGFEIDYNNPSFIVIGAQ